MTKHLIIYKLQVERCHLVINGLPIAEYVFSQDLPKNIDDYDKLFFLHYSKKIPREVYENHVCIGFHMTELPFGRGGSPLQNLIAQGHTETVLSAFRITGEMDAGDIYLKCPLSLEGTATDIYAAATKTACRMIARIVKENIQPTPQIGEPSYFKRRTPSQSVVSANIRTIEQLHDHIRMLDSEEYPRVFIEHGLFRYEFDRAELKEGGIVARVRISAGES